MKQHETKNKNLLNPVAGNVKVYEKSMSFVYISKDIQVLAGKFITNVRQPSLSGFDINTISRAEDFPIERYSSKNIKCTNLGCVPKFRHINI